MRYIHVYVVYMYLDHLMFCGVCVLIVEDVSDVMNDRLSLMSLPPAMCGQLFICTLTI